MEPELLAAIAGVGPWDLSDVRSSRTRNRELESMLTVADVPGLDPASVSVEHQTVPSGSPGRGIDVRVYRPAHGSSTGVVIMMHGGAFCMGDLDTEDLRCLLYTAHTGLTVVSVDYRLAPEHPYPAALRDCYDVLEWVSHHLDEFGGESQRIAVAGVSAGGALAAAIALLARDRAEHALAAQLLLFPVIDNGLSTASMRTGHNALAWQTRPSEQMWNLYLPQDRSAPDVDCYAAPGLAIELDGLPPAFIAIADQDPLRDEALAYGARLLESSTPVDIRLYADTYHVFDLAAPSAAVSRDAMHDQLRFLTRRVASVDAGR